MKITIINASMSHFCHGITHFIKLAKDIFKELEYETIEQNLDDIRPPYYDGETAPLVDKIMEEINSSDGIILTFPVYMKAPCALLQSFLEYLELDEYKAVIKNKHIMLLAVSAQGGEWTALGYLSGIIHEMGGFARFQLVLNENPDDNIIEKELEDFYRSIRQNRAYLTPIGDTAPKKSPIKKDSLTPKQEKDIDELSQLFVKKHVQPKEVSILTPNDDLESIIYDDYAKEPTAQRPTIVRQASFNELTESTPVQKSRTVKQITMSMPHHFEPHLSNGLSAVFQFNISGQESFNGYITIKNTECHYTDGQAKEPDITIIADSSTWLDVLNKKLTAQKAFMMGGIKVRGDFVLLTRFDSLFKL